MQVETREEIRTLGSHDLQNNLLYPGVWSFIWVKFNHMPWQLLSMTPVQAAP